MAGLGRGRRDLAAMTWPGFVDALTALLMVLIFVVTIFVVVQSMLRDQITTQSTELASLSEQLATLADALGMERARAAGLEQDLAGAKDEISAQGTLIASLTAQLDDRTAALSAAGEKITAFEAQVAALLSAKETAEGRIATLETDRARLTADLSAAETARAGVAATAEELRARLKASEDAVTAMTLALEAKRKEAEETLTLLAAAEAAKKQLTDDLTAARASGAGQLSEAARKAALLAAAEAALAQEKEISAEGQKKLALLNEQMASLRGQLASLQDLLDASAAKDAADKVQIEALGTRLNSALAQVAAEQKRRAALEEAERKRLEAEKADLEKYRSEFFGRLSEVLAGREGVRVVGDRFVFSSEVLFEPGAAELSPEGQSQIARVVETLNAVAGEIPPEIDWIIRVDGHTDNQPLSGQGEFADNWELSQARALSVVRYMQGSLGFPPERMAAAGFGEYRPVVTGNSPEARAQNRRIELKLTER